MWSQGMAQRHLGVSFDVAAVLQADMQNLQFAPPQGRLLLARSSSQVMGCIGLRPLTPLIGEVKRLYVRSTYRQQGVGRALLMALIAEARQVGYRKLRLDHAPWSDAAQRLYRSIGFYDIAPYPESDIPEEYHDRWHFLEFDLWLGPTK
jgi:ribosomal protein S18 acetylase RimI-like enzyme